MSDAARNGALGQIGTLDRLIHEPARLLICALLYPLEEADFLYLLTQSELSKGNLSSHTQKLEAAGYLATVKVFQGRIPVTSFRITEGGRTALRIYHHQLRALLPKEGKP